MFVFLSSVYTDHTADAMEFNYELARRKTAALMRHGYAVFSPIVQGHLCKALIPDDVATHSFWMDQCLEIMPRADKVIFLAEGAWYRSAGMQSELNEARKHAIRGQWHDINGVRFPQERIYVIDRWIAEGRPK